MERSQRFSRRHRLIGEASLSARILFVDGDKRVEFGLQAVDLFEVFVDPSSEDVMYRIRAASRPRSALTYIGYPLVRVLQAACRRDSCAAMKRVLSVREEGTR